LEPLVFELEVVSNNEVSVLDSREQATLIKLGPPRMIITVLLPVEYVISADTPTGKHQRIS
jgi:hypothetical protein